MVSGQFSLSNFKSWSSIIQNSNFFYLFIIIVIIIIILYFILFYFSFNLILEIAF